MNIIDNKIISDLLESRKKPDNSLIDEIIDASLRYTGLTLEQTATLLNVEDEDNLLKIFDAAKKIKNKIYGKRVVLFAPLYVSNHCTNDCLYCGFRSGNNNIERIRLETDDLKNEVEILLNQGHKRILLLMGENHSKSSLDYFIQCIYDIYGVKDANGNSIRRINIEIEALDDEDFRIINKVPIGTYTVFQETYHQPTYQQVHRKGKKADYEWRLNVMHRALRNGMNDVGIGALFGLYDYRYEVLGLLAHVESLMNEFNIGPHTISIPRLQYANNAPYSSSSIYSVSDRDFKKLVAILRLAVPYTGMILSTRESSDIRMELLNLGISQISAGSVTTPGGYKQRFSTEDNAQFALNDNRTSAEIINDIIKRGFIPSFCTACYRVGRVGEKFMNIVKQGNIKTFCEINSLTTLKEYLLDYADDKTKIIGNNLIQNELKAFSSDERILAEQLLSEIEKGKRDLTI